jgi:hypothetical protein
MNMKRFGVLLASAALATSGPALAFRGGGGGHMGGFGGGHFGGFGGGHFGGPMFAGRSVAVGGYNRGLGYNRGFNSRFGNSRFGRFGRFGHFHNRFGFFPGFTGGWDWGYPYWDVGYGGCYWGDAYWGDAYCGYGYPGYAYGYGYPYW